MARLPRIPRPAATGHHGFAAALLEGLVSAGVGAVCVCPGSRSTPLALAAASTPELAGFVHFDERSAGFLALGLARASRRPVAVICTSGTAAANLLPAVVEAHHGRVPLIVLSADRPPELRDWGAPQTIDQTRLFGACLRWYAEAHCGGADPRAGLARALGARAAALAAGSPAGPVHLNLPFREPLEPSREAEALPAGTPPLVLRTTPQPDAALLARLVPQWGAARRPLLAVGPLDADPKLREALLEFGARSGWPILADAASGLRRGAGVERAALVARGDALLGDADFATRQAPDLVVRIGPPLISKAFARWLDRHPAAPLWVVDAAAGFADPGQRAWAHVQCDPAGLLDALPQSLAGSRAGTAAWRASWLGAEAAADHAIRAALAKEEALIYPVIAAELAATLPTGALLFASNSLPVRALDGFLPPAAAPLRVLANRGANGIDGILSSALGAAAAHGGPAALLVGDLAFLHDAGALALAARLEVDLLVVAVNNDGGGIFDQLPIAAAGERVAFEELFVTPHGHGLAEIARGFGLVAQRVASLAALREALAGSAGGAGVRVIEVRVDRAVDLAGRERIQAEVSSALRGGLP